MNNQDILMLLTYINSFDATITVDQARVLAWAELLPKHITYPQAKEAATLHFRTSHKPIRPKDIIDYTPPPATDPLANYTGGLKPLCGKCDNGYVLIPLPRNNQGYIFNHVDFCQCQRDTPNEPRF